MVVLADARDPRVALLSHALAKADPAGQARAVAVGYDEVAADPGVLGGILGPGTAFRLDAPGRGRAAAGATLRAGAAAATAEGSPCLTGPYIDDAIDHPGRFLFSRQWYLGFSHILKVAEVEAARSGAEVWGCADEIALMCDKAACARVLADAGLCVPKQLGSPACYEDLVKQMRLHGRHRVFVKPRHGSSAAGVVACEFGAGGVHAWTTAELTTSGDADLPIIYNTRRVQHIRDERELAALIDALCMYSVVAEAWVPKAGLHGQRFDLRLVVIGGEPMHAVVRLSRHPMTNLHLGGIRAEADVLRGVMGEKAWSNVLETARRAAALFPRSLHIALDIAVLPGFRRHAVLEVNAFGDLLKGVLHKGRTTHEAEVQRMRELAGVAA